MPLCDEKFVKNVGYKLTRKLDMHPTKPLTGETCSVAKLSGSFPRWSHAGGMKKTSTLAFWSPIINKLLFIFIVAIHLEKSRVKFSLYNSNKNMWHTAKQWNYQLTLLWCSYCSHWWQKYSVHLAALFDIRRKTSASNRCLRYTAPCKKYL